MEKNLMQKVVNEAGGVAQFARTCNVAYQNVQKWIKKGRPPVNRVKKIEKATNGMVMRHELAPDLFEGYEPVHVNYSNNSDKEIITHE